MKKTFTLLAALFISALSHAQGYQFGIVHIDNYNFKIVATPDFTSSGNTDVSSIALTLMMPAGNADIINPTGLLGGRPWEVNSNADAAILTGYGGDGTEDAFLVTLNPGQTIFTHNIGDIIDLVSFEVSNMPTSGQMRFMLNSDPINTALGGVFTSLYNVDLDGPGNNPTSNYFTGFSSGMDSFMFSVLNIEEQTILENEITVYPNPTSEFISINTNLEVQNIELYDISGKLVLRTKETKQIKINHFPQGLYILKVKTGKRSMNKKIVVN